MAEGNNFNFYIDATEEFSRGYVSHAEHLNFMFGL